MNPETKSAAQTGQAPATQNNVDLQIARYAAGLAEYINGAGMPPAVTVLVLKSTLQEAQQLLDQAVCAQLAATRKAEEQGQEPQKEESNVQ